MDYEYVMYTLNSIELTLTFEIFNLIQMKRLGDRKEFAKS